jgi:hypothetical protein
MNIIRNLAGPKAHEIAGSVKVSLECANPVIRGQHGRPQVNLSFMTFKRDGAKISLTTLIYTGAPQP